MANDAENMFFTRTLGEDKIFTVSINLGTNTGIDYCNYYKRLMGWLHQLHHPF